MAEALGYRLGSRITLRHGAGAIPGAEHADKPFTVVGILTRTGTPVDRTVHIGLAAMEAIHLDWIGGMPLPGVAIAAGDARKFDLAPKQVTAALVGLKNRAAVFAVQRAVAGYDGEPLLAVLPGVGAGPRHVFLLLAAEGTLVTLLGAALGVAATLALVVLAGPAVQARFGVTLQLAAPTAAQWLLLAGVVGAGIAASLVPGIRAALLKRMQSKAGLTEFLLVPYFGACIHSPPPPANQIIHVMMNTPAKGVRSMDAIWLSGTLKTFRGDTSMGVSGYRMSGIAVERYSAQAPR